MNQRPHTARSNVSVSEVTELRQDLITLKLSANPRLQSLFPEDPHYDITITFGNKVYKLQKAHLRLETNYFEGDKINIKQQFNQNTFHQIMNTLYGATYTIYNQNEVYQSYQICKALRIESLIKQMENGFINSFHSFNFCIVFQLADTYQNEELKQLCLDYLETDSNAFLKLLELNSARNVKIKTKQFLLKPGDIDYQSPINLLYLNESCFRKIIQLHNQFKEVSNSNRFLPYQDIYELIKLYVQCRLEDELEEEKQKDIIRNLVVDLIDKKCLRSKEYKLIYHSDLLFKKPDSMFNNSIADSTVMEEPAIQQLNTLIVKTAKSVDPFHQTQQSSPNIKSETQKSKAQLSNKRFQVQLAFDPVLSENFLTKIEVYELKNENSQLQSEVQKLRSSLEQSVQNGTSFNQMQTHFDQLDVRLEERIGGLQQDLKEVKNELLIKKQEIVKRDQTIKSLEEQLKTLQFTISNNTSQVQESTLRRNELYNTNYSNQLDQLEQSDSRVFIEETQQIEGLSYINPDESNFTIQCTQSQFMQGEVILNKVEDIQNSQYMASEYNIIQESQLRNTQISQSMISLQITQVKKNVQFDYDPVTLDDPRMLDFVFSEHLKVNIFQKVELKQIYIGSRDGYGSNDFIRKCAGSSDVLVLIKSFDYDKNFAIYVKDVQDTENQYISCDGSLLVSLTHQFAVPLAEGKPILRLGSSVLLELKNSLIIADDCINEKSCQCQLGNYNQLTGAKQFQVDEIEAYQINITQTME